MITDRQTTLDLVALQAEKLSEEGYSVFREPNPSTLPAFLKGLRPDAIAIGREPSLVLEVVREGDPSADRISTIQNALRGTPWKLHLILANSPRPERPRPASLFDINSVIQNMRTLGPKEPRAALLMGWAALEAIARHIDPEKFQKAQSPGRVVETLAAMGYILPDQAAELRSLATLRNQFIHGSLDIVIPKSRIEKFAELIQSLTPSAASDAMAN